MDTTGPRMPGAEPIGLVGLGLMGMALAERLLEGGFAVWGYDIDPGRDDLLAASGGRPPARPRLPPPAAGFS